MKSIENVTYLQNLGNTVNYHYSLQSTKLFFKIAVKNNPERINLKYDGNEYYIKTTKLCANLNFKITTIKNIEFFYFGEKNLNSFSFLNKKPTLINFFIKSINFYELALNFKKISSLKQINNLFIEDRNKGYLKSLHIFLKFKINFNLYFKKHNLSNVTTAFYFINGTSKQPKKNNWFNSPIYKHFEIHAATIKYHFNYGYVLALIDTDGFRNENLWSKKIYIPLAKTLNNYIPKIKEVYPQTKTGNALLLRCLHFLGKNYYLNISNMPETNKITVIQTKIFKQNQEVSLKGKRIGRFYSIIYKDKYDRVFFNNGGIHKKKFIAFKVDSKLQKFNSLGTNNILLKFKTYKTSANYISSDNNYFYKLEALKNANKAFMFEKTNNNPREYDWFSFVPGSKVRQAAIYSLAYIVFPLPRLVY